jgi:integrase
VLKRVPIKPIRTEHSLDKSPAPLEALLVAQRGGLGSRGCAQNRMFHDPRVAPERDENWIGEGHVGSCPEGWSSATVRVELRRLASQAGVRRRFAPHQLRHAHALELAREGVPLNIIQRQLGHANLGTTSIYLQGIDTEEIIAAVHTRRAPMMSATAGLRL